MNETLRNDERLCLTGSLTLKDYLNAISAIGFGTIKIRAKQPYRVLALGQYPNEDLHYIEWVEVCAIKDPMPADGSYLFTWQP